MMSNMYLTALGGATVMPILASRGARVGNKTEIEEHF